MDKVDRPRQQGLGWPPEGQRSVTHPQHQARALIRKTLKASPLIEEHRDCENPSYRQSSATRSTSVDGRLGESQALCADYTKSFVADVTGVKEHAASAYAGNLISQPVRHGHDYEQ
ncbi:unnamed protein product [Diplocarpon coronariae]|nr:hypothetical protein JHW43_009261 [Diplocarpon mali]